MEIKGGGKWNTDSKLKAMEKENLKTNGTKEEKK